MAGTKTDIKELKGEELTILGISAYYHDSAAVLLAGGRIVAAAQEERFTRMKHDAAFPQHAVSFCLEQGGLNIDDLDAVVFYDKPFLKFERLLETYLHYAPRGIFSFCKAMPVWITEKIFIKDQIRKGLKKVQPYRKDQLKLLFSAHHLSHAASAFYASPFEEAAVLTVDGVGEWATASIGKGKGRQLQITQELHFPHSVGMLYSAFTYFLGFRVNSGEYKLMGLAPYGDKDGEGCKRYREIITTRLAQIYEDGSLRLHMKYFSFHTGLRMLPSRRWEKLFGIRRLRSGEEATQAHCDLALAIQMVTEDIILKMAAHAVSISGQRKLCLAGGVALNCVANGRLLRSGLVDEIFIQPAAGDAGGALGAALAAHHMYFGQERTSPDPDFMQAALLGPGIGPDELPRLKRQYKAVYHVRENMDELYAQCADLLIEGKVIGWVQGRMEFGPRALGNRSILADARYPDMQKRLNLKIKFREGFRPFAPSVAEEEAGAYFDISVSSPYMLLVAPLSGKYRFPRPEGFSGFSMKDKLYCERSVFQAITHVDDSARLHTVSSKNNPQFHGLLQAVKKKSGHPLLVNTSFNVRGEPIVCSARDAYLCFMNTGMDVLVIGQTIFFKEEQQDPDDRNKWKMSFKKD